MNTVNNRFIITGGPGSGKSSLLNQLSDHGYFCFEEISRIVIREQHKIGGDKVPWQNLADFADICFTRMSAQLLDCTATKNCFFDRGLPDIIAYLRRGGCDVPKQYFKHCKQYNQTVFLAPPWKEIFINDAERPESFEDSVEIALYLKTTYKELGFKVIELPKSTISERIQFIENYLLEQMDL